MTYAIAAGGTGGHVYPALAVAGRLVADGVSPDEVLFIGGERLESQVVPQAGFPFVELKMVGLRPLTPSKLALPWLVARAAGRARRELARRAVAVVLGMGGYITVPVAWAARGGGLPLFVHEQNAVPGLATRLSSHWARQTFVAFPSAAGLSRSRVVGNPLRPELAGFSRPQLRHQALARYSLDPGGLTIGVLGGSLGAHTLNQAVARMVVGWRGSPLQVVHLAGRAHVAELTRQAAEASLAWRVIAFEESMEFFYAASDLVISRAGALTVSELAATATPAVLVPPARLSRLNQRANAAYLVEAGAAELMDEERLGDLPAVVERLAADGGARRRMAEAAASAARTDAATQIARALREAADG
ncbi:MAG: UDP-N-acetylglucosamine--N-acetylmuramyl-(pentapeptide) pyrophosphoryl-undecaprenol N-acetylglucosamine transferase [Acidimicrobiia bacterium]